MRLQAHPDDHRQGSVDVIYSATRALHPCQSSSVPTPDQESKPLFVRCILQQEQRVQKIACCAFARPLCISSHS